MAGRKPQLIMAIGFLGEKIHFYNASVEKSVKEKENRLIAFSMPFEALEVHK